MKRADLITLLQDLAKNDLADGNDIHDHPCSVAVREIEKHASDVRLLVDIINDRALADSKRAATLISMGVSQWTT